MNHDDPYRGNILTRGLGPILSPLEILQSLAQFPPLPQNLKGMPLHIRLHYLMSVRDLHIPFQEGANLFSTADLMIRQGYRYRDPSFASTWNIVGDEPGNIKVPRSPATSAVAVGISGSGKTEAVSRGLAIYPSQIIQHEKFPQISGGISQVVWMSTDVASTGRTVDLAANLMMEWDHVTQGKRFSASLSRNRRDGMQMLDEWRQVASSHFLGLLHLDEVQNFFKLSSLERRRKRKNADGNFELSIVEDAALRWILSLTNIWQIPLLLTGTPDGIGALTKRLSTSQRLVTVGYHHISHFESATESRFREIFLPKLFEYQFVLNPIPLTDSLAGLIIELSGGIPRIVIALWIAAHRVAFERKTDDLRIDDFQRASEKYLGILKPAIAALRSRDPQRMSQYEDLVQRDDGFWGAFWTAQISL